MTDRQRGGEQSVMAEYTRRVRQDGKVEIIKSDGKVSFVNYVYDPKTYDHEAVKAEWAPFIRSPERAPPPGARGKRSWRRREWRKG